MPQWGIEPRSLTIWESIITTRPPRHHYFHPSIEKAWPHTFWTHFQLRVHIGHQCHCRLNRGLNLSLSLSSWASLSIDYQDTVTITFEGNVNITDHDGHKTAEVPWWRWTEDDRRNVTVQHTQAYVHVSSLTLTLLYNTLKPTFM